MLSVSFHSFHFHYIDYVLGGGIVQALHEIPYTIEYLGTVSAPHSLLHEWLLSYAYIVSLFAFIERCAWVSAVDNKDAPFSN